MVVWGRGGLGGRWGGVGVMVITERTEPTRNLTLNQEKIPMSTAEA